MTRDEGEVARTNRARELAVLLRQAISNANERAHELMKLGCSVEYESTISSTIGNSTEIELLRPKINFEL